MPQVEISRRFEDGIAEMSGPSTVVIGGGIAGLSAAHRLLELDDRRHVIVLESADAPGGVLRTVRKDGFLIEQSADSFLTALPYGLGLCRRVGLEDEVIPTDPAHRRAFVVSRGKLVPIPDGLMIMAPTRLLPMLTTPILGPWGKLRMGLELFIPMRDGEDESLASFAVRRFGREAYERLIQPLVGGMYTGDPERLSVRATMPRFREMERAHGSLIRAALRERSKAASSDAVRPKAAGSGARYGMFVSLRRGMASLVEALVRKLPAGTVRCGVKVERLELIEGGGWRIHVRGPERFALETDAVIVATPARDAGRLLAGVDRELAASLDRISSTSCAIASLAYCRDQVSHALDGFGFVVPKIEKRQILSGSFSSIKFPGRGPEGTVLLRAFLGGAFHPEVVAWDDDALARAAAREFADLLGIRGGPILRHISRWPGVMPQYELGHLDLVAGIEARVASHPGLALAGNAYHGAGVPQCIHSGEKAAELVAAGSRFAASSRTSVTLCVTDRDG
jgi:oxygen-dependent protoporphyrinogen oxidase